MMFLLNQQTHPLFHTGEAPRPLLVCVLGNFRLLRAGQAIALRRGGKAEILLCHLGMRYGSNSQYEYFTRKASPLGLKNALALGTLCAILGVSEDHSPTFRSY